MKPGDEYIKISDAAALKPGRREREASPSWPR